jgi:hypothetical protein
MSSPTVPYVLGGTQTERDRLITQAEGLEGSTRWMLDRIDLKPGDTTALAIVSSVCVLMRVRTSYLQPVSRVVGSLSALQASEDAIDVAIGGKADMLFCTAHVRF